MNQKSALRCALVSADDGFRALFRQVLASRRPPAAPDVEISEPYPQIGAERIKELRDARPELVLLDFGPDPEVGVRFAQFLAKADPKLVLMGAGPPLTQEQLLAAMRAGVSEYLPKPVTAEELAEAIARIEPRLGGLRAEPARHELGSLYAVFGAKGAAGTTTLAANLAVQIHRRTGGRTLVVDMDFELGDVALLLGVESSFTFGDLVSQLHRMDTDLLATYVGRHDAGVEVLSAPYQPGSPDPVAGEAVGRVLHFLRRNYDHVVVDMAKTLAPATLAAIGQASHLLLVTCTELSALRNMKRCLPLIREAARETDDALRLVVNRYDPDDVITLADVHRTLGVEVHATLRNDYLTLLEAANAGRLVALDERSRYAQDVAALAASLTGRGETAASKGAGLRNLFQRILPR